MKTRTRKSRKQGELQEQSAESIAQVTIQVRSMERLSFLFDDGNGDGVVNENRNNLFNPNWIDPFFVFRNVPPRADDMDIEEKLNKRE
jgi:hypothetical protein